MKQGEYPPDDIPVADMDSNGWPQTGRNKALRELRRAFAFHIAGDQHLGSTIQYGIESWHDAGYAFCVPAISNVWPRRWYPFEKGQNRNPDLSEYTGDFDDGFGNKMTVFAVSNPTYTGLKPARLYDRATGYGIVRFNRITRNITIECWPRLSDPSKSETGQYPGWPIKVNQYDNYGQTAKYHLPEIHVKGMSDPVIMVINANTGEIVYGIRIKGNTFQPKVIKSAVYTIRIGEPETGNIKEISDISVLENGQYKSIQVIF
jgi:hypothetical protein